MIYIPHQHYDKLEQICIKQFYSFMDEVFPEDAFKKEDLRKKVENSKPEDIPYFKYKIDTVESNEKRKMQWNYYYPFFNFFENLRDQYSKEYDYYYKYKEIPEVLHKLYQFIKTGRSIAAILKKDGKWQNIVKDLENTNELPIEIINRTSNTIANIICHFEHAKHTFKDPIETLFISLNEFIINNANNNRKWNKQKQLIFQSVLRWISSPIEFNNQYINLYGVPIPTFYSTSNQGEKIFYLNQEQAAIAIKKLNDTGNNPDFIFTIQLIAIMIAFFCAFFFNDKILKELLIFMFLIVIIIYLFNTYFQGYFWKCIKHALSVVFFFFFNKNEFDELEKREKEFKKGRMIVSNMIFEYIKDLQYPYLIKFAYSNQGVINIVSHYELNPFL